MTCAVCMDEVDALVALDDEYLRVPGEPLDVVDVPFAIAWQPVRAFSVAAHDHPGAVVRLIGASAAVHKGELLIVSRPCHRRGAIPSRELPGRPPRRS